MAAGGSADEGRGEVSMADYEIIKHLGRGAFGQVLEVRCSAGAQTFQRCFHVLPQVMEKRTKKSYALKVILHVMIFRVSHEREIEMGCNKRRRLWKRKI